MSIRFSELHCKEVILVNSGQRLGFVSDALVEVPEGTLPLSGAGGQAGGLSHPLVQNMPHRPGYYSGGCGPGKMPHPQNGQAERLRADVSRDVSDDGMSEQASMPRRIRRGAFCRTSGEAL